MMEGLLYINGIDTYLEYGVFLAEDSEDGTFNYSNLLSLPAMKEYTAVNIREENGEKLPEQLPDPCYQPRDLELQFAIEAHNSNDFLLRRSKFIKMLCAGWVSMRIPELDRTYKLYYRSTTPYSQIVPLGHLQGDVAKFKVKFREPQPTYW